MTPEGKVKVRSKAKKEDSDTKEEETKEE